MRFSMVSVHQLPYGAVDAPLLPVGDWNAIFEQHGDGVRLRAWRPLPDGKREHHFLHGAHYRDVDAAHRAAYEAGLMAYLVFHDELVPA